MADGNGTQGERRRILILAGLLAAYALFLFVRTAYWQITPHPELAERVGNRPDTIPAARGSILDASGNHLAASTIEYTVGISPKLLSDAQRELLVPQLALLLKKDPLKLNQLMIDSQDVEYILLANRLPAEVGEAIEALDSDAISMDVGFRRVYPDDQLAASLLGFTDAEGIGQYGLERCYQGLLDGTSGEWYGVRDSWGQQITLSMSGYKPVHNGLDIVLTLDRKLQQQTEDILLDGITLNKATSGNIIVLDAKTGAILAMANYPTFSPAEYGYVESMEQYINTGVSSLYEPGSVFKPLTLATALEARVITINDTYDDRGEIIVGGQIIYNSDRRAHGTTTMTELLSKSLNVGAAHVATMLGPTRFYEGMRRFGFGEVTGVDLALEVPGIMRVPGDVHWHMSDLGANSYGQGISCTPLQVAAAYIPLANDGVLMRPYIVQEIRDGQSVTRNEPVRVRQVIAPEIAHDLTDILADATESGMKKAVVPGYRFAGKSGTAGIPDQEGYQSHDIIASFVGYGPLPDPEFIVLVKFDKPREGYWGIDVAAPEFRQVAQFLVDYYGIPAQTMIEAH